MAEFIVNTDRLRSEADRLQDLQRQMNAIASKLAGIRVSSALRSSSSSVLNSRIRDCKNAVGNQASNLRKLSNGLDSIANLYDRTERDLSDPKTERQDGNSVIDGVIGWIQDILDDLVRPWRTNWPYLVLLNSIAVLGGSGSGSHGGAGHSLDGNGFLDEDGNWSLFSGGIGGSGSVLGIPCSGELGYSLIGIETDTTAEAKWDLEKGNAGVELGAEGSFHLAKGEASGNIGLLGGKADISVGNAAVSGNVNATLFKDGEFTPSIGAEAKASANVAQGSATGYLGNENYNGHVNASGSVLGAEAKAGFAVGDTGNGYGVKAEAGAEAYLAEGKISGGFTFMGIDIDVGVSGKAGGAGVEAGGSITTEGVSGEIGAGLGLGAGVEISIDWSDFDPPSMEEIGEGLQEVGQNIGEGLQQAGETINEGLQAAGEAIEDGMQAAGEAIEDGFQAAGDALADFFNW